MKKHIFCLLLAAILLTGCGKPAAHLIASVPLEVDAQVLGSVSVTLPDGMTRETVSGVQHDFIRNGKQTGGIVVVDIPAEMLDAPYDNLLRISDSLAQQVLSGADPKYTEFVGAGGNGYAYMELDHGGDDYRYAHYLFRGNAQCYDVWFDLEEIEMDAANEIIATVSSDDIVAELNESPF